MNRKQKLLTFVAVLGLALMFGCSALQDVLTPTYIDKKAAEWADTSPKLFMPYTTLFDAKRVAGAIDYKFTIAKIQHGYYRGITAASILAGEEFKQIVFSPDGPVGLLLPTIFGGTLAAMLIPRKKDLDKIKELEKKLNGG